MNEYYYDPYQKKKRTVLGEQYGNNLSLWIKLKDRNSPLTKIPLASIASWCELNDIDSEIFEFIASGGRQGERHDFDRLLYSEQFYIGVFPKTETQWTLLKLMWGEYLYSVDFGI